MALIGRASGPVAVASAVLVAACAGVGSIPSPSGPSPSSLSATPTIAGTIAASPPASPRASPTSPALAWSTIAADGPGAREDHTFTADPERGVAWLFGGRDGATVHDDLWRFDLAADEWSAVRPEGPRPAARFGHTATFVAGVGLVVWSGQAGGDFFDDLWAFDPETGRWRQLPRRGAVPAARYGSCAVLGADGRLWVSHGFTFDGRFADTRAYDFAAGRWTDVTPTAAGPIKRCLHDCLVADDGRVVLYAGQTNGVAALGDLWTLSAGRWTEAPRPPAVARQLYAAAAIGDTAWVHGGSGLDGKPLRDLWRLGLADLTWAELSPAGDRPAARSGATLVADPVRARLLLFGGQAGGRRMADLWALTGVQ